MNWSRGNEIPMLDLAPGIDAGFWGEIHLACPHERCAWTLPLYCVGVLGNSWVWVAPGSDTHVLGIVLPGWVSESGYYQISELLLHEDHPHSISTPGRKGSPGWFSAPGSTDFDTVAVSALVEQSFGWINDRWCSIYIDRTRGESSWLDSGEWDTSVLRCLAKEEVMGVIMAEDRLDSSPVSVLRALRECLRLDCPEG